MNNSQVTKTALKYFAFISFILISSYLLCPHAVAQYLEVGKASYYGKKFHGRKTASGEIYSSEKFTAAHKSLPFGTLVKVMNPKNGKCVTVRINDRGPYAKGRIIDLSHAAAEEIGLLSAGVMTVEVTSSFDSEPIGLGRKKDKKTLEATETGKNISNYESAIEFCDEIEEPGKTYEKDGNAVAVSGYGIQLGSFRNIQYATDLAESLCYEEPREIFIRIEERANQRFYQVLVGHCVEREEAQAFLSNLQKRGIEGFITKHF